MVLWVLASFLHCHSNTKTLNLTVCEFRRGGAYVRDKNTSTRLWTKNAGGAYARGGAYLRDTTVYIIINVIMTVLVPGAETNVWCMC